MAANQRKGFIKTGTQGLSVSTFLPEGSRNMNMQSFPIDPKAAPNRAMIQNPEVCPANKWTYLELYEAIWSYLKLSRTIWSYLEVAEAI